MGSGLNLNCEALDRLAILYLLLTIFYTLAHTTRI